MGLVSPTEALRRARFFSENYLNKEFDIFWGLVSDAYLDSFYSRLFPLPAGGRWFSHGNSGLFASSTQISDMQMDNLSYNHDMKILVANELKLGGKKNPDQILKYALMHKQLIERGFVHPDTRLVLCFISKESENHDWDALIEEEIVYCQNSQKETAKRAIDCVGVARSIKFVSTSWMEILDFNLHYIRTLNPITQQVELKLINGFNQSLQEKRFLHLTDRTIMRNNQSD